LAVAKDVSHRAKLEQLRDHLREERRKAVQKLGPKATARNFTLTRFITLQRAIEAAERAIQDEIAAEEKAPFDQLEQLKDEYKEEK
jgi:hypothetical protein